MTGLRLYEGLENEELKPQILEAYNKFPKIIEEGENETLRKSLTGVLSLYRMTSLSKKNEEILNDSLNLQLLVYSILKKQEVPACLVNACYNDLTQQLLPKTKKKEVKKRKDDELGENLEALEIVRE